MSTFTKLLINARNQKGLTKTQVADIFGWTRMYYGRFENGYLLPRGDNITNLHNLLEFQLEN